MSQHKPNTFRAGPDAEGRFGIHGGRFVARNLDAPDSQIRGSVEASKNRCGFHRRDGFLSQTLHRQTFASIFLRAVSPRILAGRAFISNAMNSTIPARIKSIMWLGQALLAKRMGKTKIIAETGAGQHGVATATACALFDMECDVFMGAGRCDAPKT